MKMRANTNATVVTTRGRPTNKSYTLGSRARNCSPVRDAFRENSTVFTKIFLLFLKPSDAGRAAQRRFDLAFEHSESCVGKHSEICRNITVACESYNATIDK